MRIGTVVVALVLLAASAPTVVHGAAHKGLAVTAAQTAEDAKNVKGWHGAEWDMSVEQVTTAIGAPLGDPVKTASPDAEVKCYDVQKLSVGSLTAKTRLCFGGKGQVGLYSIDLNFGDQVAQSTLRDDLKAKYGAPTSESSDSLAGGTVRIQQAKWLLALTEIRCSDYQSRTGSEVTVWYGKRRSILY